MIVLVLLGLFFKFFVIEYLIDLIWVWLSFVFILIFIIVYFLIMIVVVLFIFGIFVVKDVKWFVVFLFGLFDLFV